MSDFKINVTKSGRYTAETAGNYVDRNIVIDVPDGAAAVTAGQTISVTPTLTWDDVNEKIVASCSGSAMVTGAVSRSGWVNAVQPASVSAEGSVSAAPEDVMPIMSPAQLKSYLGI